MTHNDSNMLLNDPTSTENKSVCTILDGNQNNGVIYQWAQIVVLSIVVYLAFNLSLFGRKRKIFLGEHGSTGLGYIIAWSLIYLSQETDYITPVSAVWFVLLPLMDAILTFIRRIKSSHAVFSGDRLHFHHKLSDLGFSDKVIF